MKKPTANESAWLVRVAQYAEQHGSIPEHAPCAFEIHHVMGRSGRQNKVKVGHWFILPVAFELHNVMSNNPLNVTHFRKRFTAEFGNQRDLFAQMVEKIAEEDGENPVPEEVFNAIMATNY